MNKHFKVNCGDGCFVSGYFDEEKKLNIVEPEIAPETVTVTCTSSQGSAVAAYVTTEKKSGVTYVRSEQDLARNNLTVLKGSLVILYPGGSGRVTVISPSNTVSVTYDGHSAVAVKADSDITIRYRVA